MVPSIVHIAYEDAAAGSTAPNLPGVTSTHREASPWPTPGRANSRGKNLVTDGFEGTAAVGSFPANDHRLCDMAGNAWDWTADWWTESHPEDADKPCCIPENPRGGQIEQSYDPAAPQWRIPRKVVKGGSCLCTSNYCLRYRPAARRPQLSDTGTTNISFRCVVRTATNANSA